MMYMWHICVGPLLLTFFNVFFSCCACRDEFGSCATLALDVGHVRLAKNLAGIVEWSGRNCSSWHSFSDVDSQVEGFPFFQGIHLYIHRYNPHTTPMAYGNNRYLNMSPDLARAPRKQVVQSLARSLSRLRLLTVNFAEGELCWKG